MSGSQHKRRVAVVTGTRAEFGLLEPVMRAVRDHPALELSVVVAGSHFLPPAETWREVEAKWGEHIGAEVPMQQSGHLGRFHDAVALGHGVLGMAHALDQINPDWVVVLGDRIEAFAAASAAAVAGVGLAHLHGGDRAEGVADESIRHAISKLAHLHLAATAQSAARLERMGEQRDRIHVVGSPAIDALAGIPAADDAAWRDLGKPNVLLLFHPVGDPIDIERERSRQVAGALEGERVLWMHPNHDPGRDGVMLGIGDAAAQAGWAVHAHLSRDRFVGILKRMALEGGVIVGNSSAALIEAAALRLPAVDVGERQGGREAPSSVCRVDQIDSASIRTAIDRARNFDRTSITHPYGEGKTGQSTADLLANIDPRARAFIRKRNAY